MGTTAEKLTYLNETKTQLKDMLNLGGASLTTEPFRQYVDTLKNRYLYFMNNGTQEVWDNWEKVVGEGTTITLNNTEEAPMKIDLKGNTSQEGTPTPETPQDIHIVSGDNSINIVGTNLYNTNDITNSSISVDNEGYITISIDNSSGSSTIINNFSTLLNSLIKPSTSYSVILEVKSVSGTGRITLNETSTATQFLGVASRTFESISSNSVYINVTSTRSDFSSANKQFNSYVYCTAGEAGTIKFRVSILSNTSITANDFVYQPYQSASYPISLGVENIFNKNASGKPAYAIKTPIETGVRVIITSAGQNRYYGMNIGADELLGKTITISETITPSASNTGQTYLFFGNSTAVTTSLITNSGITGTGKQTKTISIPSSFPTNCDRIWFLIYANGTGTGNVDDYVDYTDLQMEIGSTAHSYTPYGKAIELCKIGDYQDSIVKDNGKWYLNKQIGKVVLNGSESWAKSSNTNVNRYYIPGTFINTILNVNTIDLISDYFTCITPTQSDAYNVGLSKLNNTSIMANFSLSDTSFDTLQKFKTWLSTHNTELYYVLATPTYTEITDSTLISQLEALKEAESYSGQTNISQVNNDKPFIITAKALKDLSNL